MSQFKVKIQQRIEVEVVIEASCASEADRITEGWYEETFLEHINSSRYQTVDFTVLDVEEI